MARNVRRHESTEERAEAILDELRALAKREGLEADATFLVHTAFALARCYVDTEAQARELMGTPEVPEASQVISDEQVANGRAAGDPGRQLDTAEAHAHRGLIWLKTGPTVGVDIEFFRAEGEPCPDCAHTATPGLYVGLESREPCRTCGGSTFVAGGAQ